MVAGRLFFLTLQKCRIGGGGAWAFVRVVHTIASQTVTCVSHLCGLRKCRLTHSWRGSWDFPFLKSSQLIPLQWYQLRYQIWLSRQSSGTNCLVWLIAWIGKMAECVCVHNKFCVTYLYKIFPSWFLSKGFFFFIF